MIRSFHSAAGRLGILAVFLLPAIPAAGLNAPGIEHEWGGHVKVRGGASWVDDESLYRLAGDRELYDGYSGARLNTKVFVSDWAVFETHYEAVLSGGDIRRERKRLAPRFGSIADVFIGGVPEDDRRLMDLTKIVEDQDDYVMYHRLDRLSLTLRPSWGTVCIGRQALTWGHGLIFNPMDLFNPFAPTDIERDYKLGDDLALIRLAAGDIGELQLLCVPRRDPETGDIERDQSSVAAKLAFSSGTTEFDVMMAEHCEDGVVGLGSAGYLFDAAWRADGTWTFPGEDGRDGFLSFVANMDYSWVWSNRNYYGLVEFHYNGLGKSDYYKASIDPLISERIGRGEMFTLGRTYLALEITVELHPLFNLSLTSINNAADPSGIFQPRGIWDAAENLQLTFGANISYGETGDEYGGIEIPDTDFHYKPLNNAFLWVTWYF